MDKRPPEKKICPVCGREFIDKHIWNTDIDFCNLICAEYAAAEKTGREPRIIYKNFYKKTEGQKLSNRTNIE